MKIYGNVKLGKNCTVQEGACLGAPSREFMKKPEKLWPPTKVGANSIIRSGTIIYCSVSIGKNFQSGHNVLIREKTKIGNNVLVGTNSIIEGESRIGSNVNIQSLAYVPRKTIIEDKVFLGPGATLTNDRYPIRTIATLEGPIIRKGASIGAGSVILPGVEIGRGAVTAAGAIVTKDVPPWKLAVGVPAQVRDLPKKLRILNLI